MQKDYFEELISLSKEKKARFKIEGNETEFRLKCNTDNALIFIALILGMTFPTFFLIQNYQNPLYWLIEIGLTVIILLFFRYYPSSNDILINVETQNISIINSNIMGKYLVPKVEIHFNDVTKISNEKVSIRGQGVDSYYSRIYIHSFDKKNAIIDLLNGPLYFIDYKAFMNCFAGILGKTALTSIK